MSGDPVSPPDPAAVLADAFSAGDPDVIDWSNAHRILAALTAAGVPPTPVGCVQIDGETWRVESYVAAEMPNVTGEQLALLVSTDDEGANDG